MAVPGELGGLGVAGDHVAHSWFHSPPIVLRTRYAMPGTDLGHAVTLAPLSSYALATQCPVLT
eukprot:1764540-Rhodomonas_salina.3